MAESKGMRMMAGNGGIAHTLRPIPPRRFMYMSQGI